MTEQARRKKASTNVVTLVTPRIHYGAAGGYKKILDTTPDGRIKYSSLGTSQQREVYRENAYPCKYKNREEALQELYKLYKMWTNENDSFEYPEFEECIMDTGPENPSFNPNLKSVYAIIKPK